MVLQDLLLISRDIGKYFYLAAIDPQQVDDTKIDLYSKRERQKCYSLMTVFLQQSTKKLQDYGPDQNKDIWAATATCWMAAT
jgi:hypothetical protein